MAGRKTTGDRDATASFFGADGLDDWLADEDSPATTSGSHAAQRVAPPPPPRVGAPAARPREPQGFLDNILPRTLEGPPTLLPVAPEPTGAAAEEAAAGPDAGLRLPEGAAAWIEAVAVIEAEAGAVPATARGALLAQAAEVRLRRLGDAAGARAALGSAGDLDDPRALELAAELAASGAPARAAWHLVATSARGVASAEAWRRAAGHATTRDARRSDLEAALDEDPTDLLAAEALHEVVAAGDADDDERVASVRAVVGLVDADVGAAFRRRAAARAATSGGPESRGALRAILEVEPSDLVVVGLAAHRLLADGDTAEAARVVLRAAEISPPEAAGLLAWWSGRQAWRASDPGGAVAALAQAASLGFPLAWDDLEAALLGLGRADEIVARLADVPAESRPVVAWRAAVALERAGAAADVRLAALREARALDAPCVRAAAARAWLASGDAASVAAAAAAWVGSGSDASASDLVWLGERLEALDPASPEAARWFAAAAELGEIEGLRGVARVARAKGDAAALGEVLLRLSELEPDPALAAARATEAGQALTAAGEVDRAIRCFEKAASADGGRVLALESAVAALVRAGRPREAAARLETHASSVGPEAAAPWWSAAARLRLADFDLVGALAALDARHALTPEDRAPRGVAVRLVGAQAGARFLDVLAADGSQAAREAEAVLGWIVTGTHAAPGPEALVGPGAEGSAGEARSLRGASTPLADGPGAAFLNGLSGSLPPEQGLAAAWARGAWDEVASSATAPALRAAAWERVAEAEQIRGRPAETLAAWRAVQADRPGSRLAWRGAVAAAVALGDPDAVRAAAAGGEIRDARGFALALDATGRCADAVDAWTEAAAAGHLVDRLGLEIALGAVGAWEALDRAWSARSAVTASADVRTALDARRRRNLDTHLAGTEHAWESYRRLHAERPTDRDVAEAFAAVATARGDTDTALSVLVALVPGASSVSEATRHRRRIAEVRAASGDLTGARQDLLDVLAADPDDVEVLRVLRDVADRLGDAETLLVSIEREAARAVGSRRVELLRDAARVAGKRLVDPARAMIAWRAVLDAQPGDLEGLRGLVAEAEAAADVGTVLKAGAELALVEVGAARSSLLRRLGEHALAVGRGDEGLRWLEEAVESDVPDVAAAARLEALHRESGDHEGLARALLAQATLATDTEVRVARLRDAARCERDLRHDRDAAHRIFARLLDVLPEDAEALRFEGAWMHERGRLGEALVLHERLERVGPSDVDLADFDGRFAHTAFLHRLGSMLAAEGRRAEARARFDAALALFPYHLPSLEAVGPLAVAESDWPAVGEIHERLLAITGGQGEAEPVARAFAMLGNVDLHAGRIERATERFHRALGVFPNYVPALKGLARVHEARGDWQSALTAHNDVIYNATVPEDVTSAYMTKGRILDEAMGRPDKAAQHYERSLAFEAEQPAAYLRLAEVALRQGRWDEVIDTATRGLAFAAEGSAIARDLHVAIAIARARLDDVDGARAAWASASAVGEVLPAGGLDDLDAATSALRARLPA